MYYTGTEEQCIEYDRIVTEGQNYRGGTTNWANLRKHPTKKLWAIKKHPNYESSLPLIELTPDWYKTEQL
jgi:hypothetical protein